MRLLRPDQTAPILLSHLTFTSSRPVLFLLKTSHLAHLSLTLQLPPLFVLLRRRRIRANELSNSSCTESIAQPALNHVSMAAWRPEPPSWVAASDELKRELNKGSTKSAVMKILHISDKNYTQLGNAAQEICPKHGLHPGNAMNTDSSRALGYAVVNELRDRREFKQMLSWAAVQGEDLSLVLKAILTLVRNRLKNCGKQVGAKGEDRSSSPATSSVANSGVGKATSVKKQRKTRTPKTPAATLYNIRVELEGVLNDGYLVRVPRYMTDNDRYAKLAMDCNEKIKHDKSQEHLRLKYVESDGKHTYIDDGDSLALQLEEVDKKEEASKYDLQLLAELVRTNNPDTTQSMRCKFSLFRMITRRN